MVIILLMIVVVGITAVCVCVRGDVWCHFDNLSYRELLQKSYMYILFIFYCAVCCVCVSDVGGGALLWCRADVVHGRSS